ncbi:OLC1v1005713C1 [Oldenlandia corymbosa var. corymbosa]|uniref:OLC1v1005713C1 n=1 Tax=Oldenlandia corymbosa var. corymbosa TaxID=529605 RepID=A0AAV1DGI5_OLDCO|nr:OLC1v1005713C1 [Oldenlandia corymbosa var. corymbosa]
MAFHSGGSTVLPLFFLLLPILLTTLLFPFQASQAEALATTSSNSTNIILRVTKDPETLQHTTIVQQRTPLVPIKLAVDLGGEALWVACEENGYKSSSFEVVRCGSATCATAGFTFCADSCAANPRPWYCDRNACVTTPVNPFTNIHGYAYSGGQAADDVLGLLLLLGSSNAARGLALANRFVFTCVPVWFSEGLARGVKGIAGLGANPGALPTQLSHTFNFLRRKFVVCLSSSTKSSSGFVAFGESVPLKSDISKSLIYTPIVKHPVGKKYNRVREFSEYYVGLKSIKINGKPVPLNTTLLSFDEGGNGGTKISTADPYTVLESSIYQNVIKAFLREIPSNVARVAPVKPFGACFKLGSLVVPPIDLVFQSNQKGGSSSVWRISGTNLMVRVNKDVACLGFVEYRKNLVNRAAVSIGAHQIEETLLEFDLILSRVGFSPSLLSRKTSCALQLQI